MALALTLWMMQQPGPLCPLLPVLTLAWEGLVILGAASRRHLNHRSQEVYGNAGFLGTWKGLGPSFCSVSGPRFPHLQSGFR